MKSVKTIRFLFFESYILQKYNKYMLPKGDLPCECVDCGEQFTYSKKSMQTHSELLKKHRCPKCGHFALKTKSKTL
jgi:DNA-directed RNA polymerase subunit RPC12/RpoP